MSNLQQKTSRTRAHAHPHARKLYVLVACEESQAVTAAFRALGHVAYSCDLQPCRRGGNPYWHIQGDVAPLLRGDTAFNVQAGFLRCVPAWDLIIAHPPCTYLCKVGSQHLFASPDGWRSDPISGEYLNVNTDRWRAMLDAARFFRLCLNAQAPYVAVENPIPMRRALLPPPSTYVDPSWFGHKYTKKTLLWLRNLPPLWPTITHPHPRCFVNASRGKYRSRTFPGVAQAMAEQWAAYILEDLAR